MSSVHLPKALSSYDEYAKFMSGKEHISKLKAVSMSKESFSIDKFPYLKIVLSIFKNFVVVNVHANLSRIKWPYYTVFKKHDPHNDKVDKAAMELLNKIRFGTNHLVTSANKVSPDYEDISIDLTRVDKQIKDTLIDKHKGKNSLELNEKNNGICRGMSTWFDFLYTNTKEMFKDKPSESHIKAVANIFKNGSPIEGYLMQKFATALPIQNKLYMNSVYAQKFDDPFSKIKDTQDVLKQLPIGNYMLMANCHACNLIKVSDDCMYFWDPNLGLLKIKDSDLEKAFLNVFKKVLCKDGKKNSFVLFKRDSTSNNNLPNVSEVKPDIFIFQGSRGNFPICNKTRWSKKWFVIKFQVKILWLSFVLVPIFFLKCCFERHTSFNSIMQKTSDYFSSKDELANLKPYIKALQVTMTQ
ncbi:MAG: hypothetical protein KR126chlam5_01508 [Candidatus Anoxychlamydiales bacterium]|nr:hypothetical protein [Candidatus Anoxychlamydiales bacterium]